MAKFNRQPIYWSNALDYINIIFQVIFLVEAVIKIMAYSK